MMYIFFTSNNMAVPTKLFRKYGGFQQEYTHFRRLGVTLCDRWLFSDYYMKYALEMIIYHAQDLSL